MALSLQTTARLLLRGAREAAPCAQLSARRWCSRTPLTPADPRAAAPPSGDGHGDEPEESKEALEERKRRAVQSYLEQQLGLGGDADRAVLAALLHRHGVAVRGGQEEALRLMEALAAWKQGTWAPDA